jgi:hypothetical protein
MAIQAKHVLLAVGIVCVLLSVVGLGLQLQEAAHR